MRWTAALVFVLTAGCAENHGPPTVASDEDGNIHAYVSNQSFEQPWADLLVTLDGAILFDGWAHVAQQHNWTLAEARAGPGSVTVSAIERESGASNERSFEVTAGEERWIVIEFWESGKEAFVTINVHDEPVMFA